mgnify:CR=1 FL=1
MKEGISNVRLLRDLRRHQNCKLVKSQPGWQSKKFKIKAPQIPRNEAYLSYAAVTRDAAQRRYWTFYEAIKIYLKKHRQV